MSNKKIEGVTVALVSDKLVANTIVAPGTEEALEFAFYVYRNNERIHVEWYSKTPRLEYDVGYVPGYYRVEAFAKAPDDSIECVRSAMLFINPVVVDAAAIAGADLNQVAYVLKGVHWKFPVLFFPNPANRLFVLMPSAIERAGVNLPVFSRWTWAVNGVFPGNVLCISDPTVALHANLALGWCLGNREHCATDELAEFVTAFADARGIPRENIVIYGSSAGGFAGLALAARIPGTTVVAINAQTNAFAYQVTEQVALVNQSCFGGLSLEQTREAHADRIDMVTRWAGGNASRVILVQNETDVHHYDIHFKPFWESLGGTVRRGWSSAGIHQSWVYTAEGGHIAETAEMAQELIATVIGEHAVPAGDLRPEE